MLENIANNLIYHSSLATGWGVSKLFMAAPYLENTGLISMDPHVKGWVLEYEMMTMIMFVIFVCH